MLIDIFYFVSLFDGCIELEYLFLTVLPSISPAGTPDINHNTSYLRGVGTNLPQKAPTNVRIYLCSNGSGIIFLSQILSHQSILKKV